MPFQRGYKPHHPNSSPEGANLRFTPGAPGDHDDHQIFVRGKAITEAFSFLSDETKPRLFFPTTAPRKISAD